MIEYTSNLDRVDEDMLSGFFAGWPNPPSKTAHMKILRGSYCVWLAIDTTSNMVVGFINAISDGVLSAYIPLLEVLSEYKNRGVGSALVTYMLKSLNHLYMVDLLCDEDNCAFYAKFGMMNATGTFLRNFDRQNCM